MTIAVRLNPYQKEEWDKKGSGTATVHFMETWQEEVISRADVFIDLLYTGPYALSTIPSIVLVNAVIETCATLPAGYIRINAWPGFLQRAVAELAAAEAGAQQQAAEVMKALGWDYRFTPDIPGMITTPVIAMIINEAFFALEEEVSTKTEIDTAMKLGTNYPYGPFEWCDKIGGTSIYRLLQQLSSGNKRYTPAPLLQKAYGN